MKVRVILVGRFEYSSTCCRNIYLKDAQPDDAEIINSLIRDLEDRRGPLFTKMRLPEHIAKYRDPLFWNMTVVIDNSRVYSVREDGSIIDLSRDGKKISIPTELDF